MWGSSVLIPIKRNIALQVGIPTSLLRLDFAAAQDAILFKSRQAKASSGSLFKEPHSNVGLFCFNTHQAKHCPAGRYPDKLASSGLHCRSG